jgi:PIN domain nuclease of toxin-antitoxin system
VIVLDTHVLIWDALTPKQLSAAARQAIAQADQQNNLIIADISLWEIAMLIEKKRVQIELGTQAFLNLILQAHKAIVQPITAAIATLAIDFPAEISKDPADRLIAATTLTKNATLITADKNLQNASLIPTLW